MQEILVQSLSQEDPLEKETATHSSGLENPMDREAWWVIVHGVAKSSIPFTILIPFSSYPYPSSLNYS